MCTAQLPQTEHTCVADSPRTEASAPGKWPVLFL